jgi:large subunit ribosomal protein L4
MPTIDILSPTGTKSGSVDLPDDVFDVQTNIPLIHQVVVGQLAAARQGTASTKTRGEVRGGGRKPHAQKGTGRARQGSTRAPQFVGGGVVHGPKPRDYSQRTPKKMKAAALRGALSDRARHGRIHVFSSLVEGDNPSTKAAGAILDGLSERKNLLVVVEREDTTSWRSLRNLENVHVLVPDQLNTYDVLCADDVVFTEGSLSTFLAGPTKGGPAKAVAVDESAVQDTAKADKPAPAVKAEKPATAAKAEKPATAAKADKPATAAKADKPATAAKADKPATAAKADKPATAAKADKVEGPFGLDSAEPLDDGSAPEGFTIKGNKGSMKYHTTESQWYDRTVAEVWFRSAEAAEAAGFVAPGSKAKSADDEEDAK